MFADVLESSGFCVYDVTSREIFIAIGLCVMLIIIVSLIK